LPTVAQLAVANMVGGGTAHRALTLLKAEGFIEVVRSHRATVSASIAEVATIYFDLNRSRALAGAAVTTAQVALIFDVSAVSGPGPRS
jgi:DNA-binding transcriptional regulator YhcF (GntR family)